SSTPTSRTRQCFSARSSSCWHPSIEAKQEGAKQVLSWIDGCQHDEDLALKHWRVLEVGVDEAPGQRREIASVFRKSTSLRFADVARQNPANAHIELERPALRM